MLAALTRALDWVWIAGNHDGGYDGAGGTAVDELETGGLILCHHARAGERRPELSSHFHSCLIVSVRGRWITRPCAVRSEHRLILPAFGALTGDMDAASPEILAALQPAAVIDALATAQGKLVEFPLWRAASC